MADLLLPEASDLESTQLIRMGATKYMEQFWDCHGVVLRQAAVAPQGEARDFTWITTELAKRTGLLPEYIAALNRGIAGVSPLKGKDYDYSLDPASAARARPDLGFGLPRRDQERCQRERRSTDSTGTRSTGSTPCRRRVSTGI